MASKKGIIVTAIILGVITAASFLVWMIPQTYDAAFVVTDYENHLNGIKNIHLVITEDIDSEFQKLVNGKISPDEYIRMAETSNSQINSQIINLVESNPTEEWQDSYISYMDSLKQSNTYIRETIVFANMLKDGAEKSSLENTMDSVNNLKDEVNNLIQASDDARP